MGKDHSVRWSWFGPVWRRRCARVHKDQGSASRNCAEEYTPVHSKKLRFRRSLLDGRPHRIGVAALVDLPACRIAIGLSGTAQVARCGYVQRADRRSFMSNLELPTLGSRQIGRLLCCDRRPPLVTAFPDGAARIGSIGIHWCRAWELPTAWSSSERSAALSFSEPTALQRPCLAGRLVRRPERD